MFLSYYITLSRLPNCKLSREKNRQTLAEKGQAATVGWKEGSSSQPLVLRSAKSPKQKRLSHGGEGKRKGAEQHEQIEVREIPMAL